MGATVVTSDFFTVLLEKLRNVAYASQDFGRHDPRRGFLVPLVAQEQNVCHFFLLLRLVFQMNTVVSPKVLI